MIVLKGRRKNDGKKEDENTKDAIWSQRLLDESLLFYPWICFVRIVSSFAMKILRTTSHDSNKNKFFKRFFRSLKKYRSNSETEFDKDTGKFPSFLSDCYVSISIQTDRFLFEAWIAKRDFFFTGHGFFSTHFQASTFRVSMLLTKCIFLLARHLKIYRIYQKSAWAEKINYCIFIRKWSLGDVRESIHETCLRQKM